MPWEEYEVEMQRQRIIEKDLDTLAQLKEQYGDKWLDEKWIKDNIGRFPSPAAEYYWTLIGDKGFQVVDWKGNLKIRKDVYDKILEDRTFATYSGEKFLKENFTNKKGYPARIRGTYIESNGNYGIYGIYYEDEIVYVGMTQKGFEARWKEHMDIFTGAVPAPLNMRLYAADLDLSKIEFKELINMNEVNYNGTLTYRELKAMELACIHMFKPKYNTCGLTKPYVI